MFRDYYAILVISQSASRVEIKSAYKKQAIKWHPDKNQGVDTTQRMQEINEAYLILNDDEARTRYDREYLRFKKFKDQKNEEFKQQKTERKKDESQQKEQRQEAKTEKSKEKEFSFQFDDEILKRWMENARKQAIRNVHEMVTEFKDSSLIGFGAFFSNAIKAIIIAFIFFVIVIILKYITQ